GAHGDRPAAGSLGRPRAVARRGSARGGGVPVGATPASEHLRGLAERIVHAALERVPLRAALLVGSAARGDADFYSDLDLLLYVDELPPDDKLTQIRIAAGGTNPIRRTQPVNYFRSEEFHLDGVRTEVSLLTVRQVERRLDDLFDDSERFDSPLQKILSGVLEGLPLYGGELIGSWQDRVGDYPE